MAGGTLFTRLPGWIREALATQEPDVPNILGAVVDPVLEVGQGGWAFHSWSYVFTQQPASTAATLRQIVAADVNLGTLVYQDINHNGGAAALLPELALSDPVTGNWGIVAKPSIAVGITLGHADMVQTVRPIIVPPGFAWAVWCPATGVGETLNLGTVFTRFRRGFNPL